MARKHFPVKLRAGTTREKRSVQTFQAKKKAHRQCTHAPNKAMRGSDQLPPLIKKPLVEGPVEADVPAILDR